MVTARRSPSLPSLLALLALLPLLALMCLVGCASKSYGGDAMAPGYYGEEYAYADELDYGAAGGGEGAAAYDFEDDYAEAEVEEMVMREEAAPARVSAGRSRARSSARAQKRDAPSPSSAAEPPPEGGEASEPLDAGDPSGEAERAQTSSKKRQVIYTATMQVSVYDLPAALAFAEELPSTYGGWLQQRQDNRFVLRVPAERLDEVMKVIGELGVVELRTLEGLDVTDQYTDLESRIRVLEQMQAHLQELLAKAKTVEQSLEIRKVLDAVTLELESAKAQMRSLAQSIAFSTLILTLTERGPAQELPDSNDPFTWVDSLGAEATEFR